MNETDKKCLKTGLREGIPIMLGYLSVGFTLGIAARNSGLTAFQATVTSLLMNASAGEFAGFTAIAEKAGYLEAAVMILIINARYFLMSCSLSQKLPSGLTVIHRFIMGYDITDELFGAAISKKGKINPWYFYGLMMISIPGWASGTCLGVLAGTLLPPDLISAFSMGIYGMFIAVVIPPAGKSRSLLVFILAVAAASYLLTVLPFTRDISSGMRTMILTVFMSAGAALFAPERQVSQYDS